MRNIKRILAALLSIMMLFGIISISGTVAHAVKLNTPGQIRIETTGKSRTLKLTWNKVPEAKGYQIYRSTNGKKGSYERIAVVKKAAYVDRGLKNSTTYYYKIRAYAKQNGKNVYGTFAKANLSTKVTANYVVKRFNAVYKAIDRFFTEEAVTNEKTYMVWLEEDLEKYGVTKEGEYISSKFQTKAEAVSALQKYFTKKVATNLVADRFYYIDGELYLWVPIGGAEEYMILDKTTASINKRTDKLINVTIYSIWGEVDREYLVEYTMNVEYVKNRWVFDENRVWHGTFYPYGYSYYS